MTPSSVRVSGGKAWKWSDDVYGIQLYLFACAYNDMATVLNRSGWGIERRDREALGTSLTHEHKNGSHGYAIWVPSSVNTNDVDDLNTVTHECVHVAMTALMHRGLNADPMHQEPYCYYISYLVEQCVRLLRSRK